MNSKMWQKIKKVFSATEKQQVNRPGYLSENKTENPDIKNDGSPNFSEEKTQPLSQYPDYSFEEISDQALSDPFANQKFESYSLLQKIGSGGMGEIYIALDSELNRKVAIKILPAEFTRNKTRVLRFKQEAQAISKLNHPNILTIHKVGHKDGVHYIVTELVKGFTLRQQISLGMDVTQTLEVIVQVASALKAAHEAGIIHRDIKPENIMIRPDGLVKVLDFGLAKLVEQETSDSLEVKSFQTETGLIIGTPSFMSPEQIDGETIDYRTDYFSLGAVLYECLTNQPAFPGKTVSKVLTQIINIKPPPPSKINSQVLPALDDITLKLLKKNPQDRYQTADEIISDLKEIKSQLRDDAAKTKNFKWKTRNSTTGFIATFSNFARKNPLRLLLIPVLLTAAFFVFSLLRAPVSYSSKNPEALKLFHNGTEALRSGTYFKASKLFEDAISLDGNFVLAHARLAEAWTELDYVGRAQNELLKVRNIQQNQQNQLFVYQETDGALYIDAVNATALRDFPKAVEIYETLVQRLPDEPHAYLDLGRAYEKNEQIEKAIESYQKATALNSQYPGAFLRLGILLSRKSEFEKAFEAFDSAENVYDRLSDDEGIADVKFQRGVSFNRQEKLGAARREFEQVLNIPRANKYQKILALMQISSVCCSEGNTACAQDYASRGIQFARDERMENLATSGLIDLGNAFLARGEHEEANRHYFQALEFARTDNGARNEARALLALGSLRIQDNKPAEAQEFIQQSLPFYQNGGYKKEVAQANILLGRAYEKNEDFDRALETFRRLENSEDTDMRAYAHLAIGNVLTKQERLPAALKHFNQSHDLYKSLGNNYLLTFSLTNLSDVLARLGLFGEARDKIFKAEEIVKTNNDLLKQFEGKIQLRKAQIAFYENDFAGALKHINKPDYLKDSSIESEIQRIVFLSRSKLNPRESSGVEMLEKVLQSAIRSKENYFINTIKLSLAEAYLINNNFSKALETAVQAQDYFVSKKDNESAWRALVITALAADKSSDDRKNVKDYASVALRILSQIKADWGDEYFSIYLAKPDVKLYYNHARQLAAEP